MKDPSSTETPPRLAALELRPDRVVLFAPDLNNASRFYTDVLGFQLLGATDQQLRLECGGLPIDIFRCQTHRSYDSHSYEAGCALAFEVTDLEAAVVLLQEHGVRVLHDAPGVNDSGQYVAFCDPFGTVHELLQLKPKR